MGAAENRVDLFQYGGRNYNRYVKIDGVDSSEAVFEIFYDARRAAVSIQNLELDELVSTVFMRMNP